MSEIVHRFLSFFVLFWLLSCKAVAALPASGSLFVVSTGPPTKQPADIRQTSDGDRVKTDLSGTLTLALTASVQHGHVIACRPVQRHWRRCCFALCTDASSRQS